MKICFLGNNLPISGGNCVLYDYAKYNQILLHNTSIILADKNNINHLVYEKFRKDLDIILYSSQDELETLIKDLHVDALYMIKEGSNDNVNFKGVENLFHGVFNCDPHGDKYALVSKWLAEHNKFPHYVPHIVELPNHNDDFRKELNISEDTIVFGRYGSYNTFDIDWVHNAINKIMDMEVNIHFLFMNTSTRIRYISHNRVNYFQATTDLYEKRKFINTCDAMIHARTRGETFGLAPMEFSFCNKPVYSYFHSLERAHIDQLGNKGGVYYSNEQELIDLILAHKKEYNQRDWNCAKEYSPEIIMQKFNDVFLK